MALLTITARVGRELGLKERSIAGHQDKIKELGHEEGDRHLMLEKQQS